MNGTLWNSTEEAFGYFLMGAVSILIHAYAMFLSSAISDYQDEKPKQEKSPYDEFIKELMNLQFFALGVWSNSLVYSHLRLRPIIWCTLLRFLAFYFVITLQHPIWQHFMQNMFSYFNLIDWKMYQRLFLRKDVLLERFHWLF